MKKIVAVLLSCLGVSYGNEAVVAEILPSADELGWQAVDWKTDLWEARVEAAKLGKPIYLWEMDGNPLGCV